MELDSDYRNNSSKTVDKALRLLQLVATNNAPLTVTRAAELLGTSPAVTHRLLQSLTKSGWLIQNESRAYALGPTVLEVAQHYLNDLDIRQRCRPLLGEVRNMSGETTCLFIKQGNNRVLIDYAWSQFDIAYVPQIGETLPITIGATGRAYLSTLSEGDRHQLLMQLLAEPDNRGYRHPLDIEDALQLIEDGKQRGYFESISERIPGMASAAFPIVSDRGSLVATISVIGPSDRWTKDRISEVCPAIAKKVSSYRNLTFQLNSYSDHVS